MPRYPTVFFILMAFIAMAGAAIAKPPLKSSQSDLEEILMEILVEVATVQMQDGERQHLAHARLDDLTRQWERYLKLRRDKIEKSNIPRLTVQIKQKTSITDYIYYSELEGIVRFSNFYVYAFRIIPGKEVRIARFEKGGKVKRWNKLLK